MAEVIYLFRNMIMDFIWIEVNLKNYKILDDFSYGENACYFLCFAVQIFKEILRIFLVLWQKQSIFLEP